MKTVENMEAMVPEDPKTISMVKSPIFTMISMICPENVPGAAITRPFRV